MSEGSAATAWLGPHLARLLQRFPWAVLAAVAFAAYFVFGLHRTSSNSQVEFLVRGVRIPCGLTLAFLWSLVVALYGEARNLGPSLRHGATLVGFAAIALLVAFADRLDLLIGMPVGALMLLVGLAPYIGRTATQTAYWRFNHDVWVAFLASVVATVLFGAGLSAIVETLRYLFGFNISYEAHEKIWAVACGLVGPIYWASVIPEDFTAEIAEGPPTEFISRMVALLVKFILVPLLLAYAVILHIYAAKILLDWALPKGRLGWLVLSFGTMTVLTALLAYPTRNSGGPLVALFWRLWPLMLAIPLVMLFLAAGTRINAYGVTESRYWVVVIGVWLASLAVVHGTGIVGRDLRLIPGVLAVLTMLVCLGPWGLHGWTMRSQLGQFALALDKAGMLKDGRVPPEPHAKPKVGSPDAYKLAGLVQFFSGRYQIARLQPFFAGDANDPFKPKDPGKTGSDHESVWQLAERVRGRLGIGGSTWNNQSPNFVNHFAAQPWVARIGDGQWLVSSIHSNRSTGREPTTAQRLIEVAGLKLRATLEHGRLVVEDMAEGGARAVFELAPLDSEDGPLRSQLEPSQKKPFVLEPNEGTLPVTLVVNQIAATRGGTPAFSVGSLGYALIVREKR